MVWRLARNENTAPVVRRIFDLYDRGAGYKSIAMKLNEEGFRTNKGRLFRVTFISRTLRNRAYIGILDYNRYQGRGAREPIEIPGFYPAIIDRELFGRIQEKLKGEKDYFQNAFAHRTEYLLSRLVVCDFCGHHYLGTAAKSGKHHYYSCSTYLRRGPLQASPHGGVPLQSLGNTAVFCSSNRSCLFRWSEAARGIEYNP